MKKIIGISGSIEVECQGMLPGYEKAYIGDVYVQSVIRANAIPYILPIVEDEAVIRQMVQGIDGLILSGGHDVNPLDYNEEPHYWLGEILPV